MRRRAPSHGSAARRPRPRRRPARRASTCTATTPTRATRVSCPAPANVDDSGTHCAGRDALSGRVLRCGREGAPSTPSVRHLLACLLARVARRAVTEPGFDDGSWSETRVTFCSEALETPEAIAECAPRRRLLRPPPRPVRVLVRRVDAVLRDGRACAHLTWRRTRARDTRCTRRQPAGGDGAEAGHGLAEGRQGCEREREHRRRGHAARAVAREHHGALLH